jgi:hypothetical protein
MSKRQRWTNSDLRKAVKNNFSVRGVLIELGLVPAGGNYVHVADCISKLRLPTKHFTGKGWRKNRTFEYRSPKDISELLVKGSRVQSFKLKKRLFLSNLKSPKCELCGWAEQSIDGRIPVELDHINGDRYDNRLENLRVLCPNCHSLQSTHRGMNQKRRVKQ